MIEEPNKEVNIQDEPAAPTYDGDDDLRQVKYQFHSWPTKVFFLYLWPRLNYFWMHISYIILAALIGGWIIYEIEQSNLTYANGDRPRLSYIDCTLSATTAITNTGMGTLDFWALRNGSKLVHLCLSQLGSIVFVAAMTAFIRHPERKYRGQSDNLLVCHRALLKLGVTLVIFNALMVLVCGLLLTLYANTKLHSTLRKYNADPTWFAFFTVISGFNQTGFSFLRDGLIPFNNDIFVALVLMVNILVSNAFLPLVMRMILSVLAKRSKDAAPYKFLLEHPRICSTILFPSIQTRMLSAGVAAFLTLQVLTFSLLDYNYPVIEGMNGWQQFVVTIFQAANTITTGYPVVQIDETSPGQQWCYFIYMLVAIYPYVSMLRNTEVISEGRDFFHPDSLLKQSQREDEFGRRMIFEGRAVDRANVVMNASVRHLKRAFLDDAFWLILAIFAICVFDGKAIETDVEYHAFLFYLFHFIFLIMGIFSMWKVVFEVAAAYGTVGLSLGYPSLDGGFSQVFSQRAKVIMVGISILGRHRGMPRNKDVAVMQIQALAQSSHPENVNEEVQDV